MHRSPFADVKPASPAAQPERPLLPPAPPFVPPLFSGASTEAAPHWIYKVALALADRPDVDTDKAKILFASRYLDGPALEWLLDLLQLRIRAGGPRRLDPDDPTNYLQFEHNIFELGSYASFTAALRRRFAAAPFAPRTLKDGREAEGRVAGEERTQRDKALRREMRKLMLQYGMTLLVVAVGSSLGWKPCTETLAKCVAWWRGAGDDVVRAAQEANRLREELGGEL